MLISGIKPDYVGQPLKVGLTTEGTVYEGEPCIIQYGPDGKIIRVEKATKEDIQWYMQFEQSQRIEALLRYISRMIEMDLSDIKDSVLKMQ
jgi:hypothetical protein